MRKEVMSLLFLSSILLLVSSGSAITLVDGWNLISVDSQSENLDYKQEDIQDKCDWEGGPWTWDREEQDYAGHYEMRPNRGYFVKVEGECELNLINDEEETEEDEDDQNDQNSEDDENNDESESDSSEISYEIQPDEGYGSLENVEYDDFADLVDINDNERIELEIENYQDGPNEQEVNVSLSNEERTTEILSKTLEIDSNLISGDKTYGQLYFDESHIVEDDVESGEYEVIMQVSNEEAVIGNINID